MNDIMDLIDAYAEARHRCGCAAYNATTADARQLVVDYIASIGAGGVQALSAGPAVPEGWKLVPVEPTREMLEAPSNAWPADAKVTRAAMLAASPTPPALNGVFVTREQLRGWMQWCAQSMSHAIEGEIGELPYQSDATPPAEQQAQPGAVYAELPAPTASIGADDAWHEAAMRDFADRTHALRMRAAPKAAPGERCQHCINRTDGFYGSYAPPCPHHDDDGKPRAQAAPQQEATKAAPGEPRGCEMLMSDGEWCQYPMHRYDEAKAQGHRVRLIYAVEAAPQQEAQEPDANWEQLRSALAMVMMGFCRREDQTSEACYSVLDSVTEPGMPLALLRSAPDWRTQVTTPQPAPAPLSESEYRRGYRHGYERRDAEVRGALA